MNSTLGSVVPLAMFCYIYSRAALGAFVGVKVHVMARRLLRSVRHRTLKPPSYVLHVILSSLLFIFGTCASFRVQEPRPSLKSSNHSRTRIRRSLVLSKKVLDSVAIFACVRRKPDNFCHPVLKSSSPKVFSDKYFP